MSLFGFIGWHVKRNLGAYLYVIPLLLTVLATAIYPNASFELGLFLFGWMFGAPFLYIMASSLRTSYEEYKEEKR